MADLWNVKRGINGLTDGPRDVTRDELHTYLRWIAARAGVYVPDDAVYGPEGISTRANGVIVPMPGYGQPQTVTMEALDETGAVIRSSTIGLDSKGKLKLDAKAVRAIAGKVEKPAKPRAARKPRSAPVDASAVIAALVARVEALEAAAVAPAAPSLTTCASLPVPANDTTARPIRTEREATAIRRAWRIRCEARQRRDLDVRALEAANGAYRGAIDALTHRTAELATMTAQQANARRSASDYKREMQAACERVSELEKAETFLLERGDALRDERDAALRRLFGAEERAAAAERRATRMVRAAADYRTQAKRLGEDARGLKAEARALARRLDDARRDVAASRARPTPPPPTDTAMARAFAALN